MKKVIALFLLIVGIAASATAQVKPLQDTELAPIFQMIEAKEWEKVNDRCNALLEKHDGENSNATAFTRYAALYSAAAMVAEGKTTFEAFEKYTKKFVNKAVITASHPTSTDTTVKLAINTVKLTRLKDSTIASFVTVTDAERKKIYSQEIVTYNGKFDIEQFNNQRTFTGGYIKAIEVNPEKKTNWIMRLTIDNANIQIWKTS